MNTIPRRLVLLAVLAVPAGCSDKPAPPPVAPPEVTVMTIAARDVPFVSQQVGQTAGFRETEVRARVSGILQKRLYAEGQPVTAGQPLFQIDPAPYQAALDQARGQLRQQEAALERARADRDRIEPLFKENAVSRKDYDDARAAYDAAAAAVDSARARVKETELNLGYTLVTAPIAGIASREAKSEGSLVSATGDASLLTAIAQLDPLYVNFSYSESEKLQYDRAAKEGRVVPPAGGRVLVRVVQSDGTAFPGAGTLDFADSRVDPRTGTIRARAEIPNPKGDMLPGQFVRVTLNVGTQKGALFVPERAVTQQQAARIVLVVDDKNTVQARPVTVGRHLDGDVEITSGVKAGERIVVDGLMKARPGSPVQPIDASAARAPGAAAPAAVRLQSDSSLTAKK
jgi:membrane fusion protein (multidrug efflux system)